MNQRNITQQWNLACIFQGGSQSLEFQHHLQKIKQQLSQLQVQVAVWPTSFTQEAAHIHSVLTQCSKLKHALTEATSFIACLLAQNPGDKDAKIVQGKMADITSTYHTVLQTFQTMLANITEAHWHELLQTAPLHDFILILNEWRDEAKPARSAKEQALLSSLMADGYHSWGQMYQALMNTLHVTIVVAGQTQTYSIRQALNLRSHPEREVRKAAHETLERTWAEQQDMFAKMLNHIAGFRLQMYNLQGIPDLLHEPLQKNRMTPQTLNAMWSVVDKHKQHFAPYLQRKAQMQQQPNMQAYDFWSPLHIDEQVVPYEEALQTMKTSFRRLGPQHEQFIERATIENWIEAENRAGKAMIAFCASFPLAEQSRVFMTYDGTILSMLTLAHELGHAFHNDAVSGQSALHQQYPLSIAETASIFSELMLLDTLAQQATTPAQKIALLDEKLKRSIMNFMNMHSRFLFEQTFYEERQKGIVLVERLNDLMQQAISVGYDDSLEGVSVYSWAWTPHYYVTTAPFYNFPYTFGYLLASSLFALFQERGIHFEEAYIQLLRDAGKLSLEALIEKHLDEDITQETFWEKGMAYCLQDVDDFLALTASSD